MNANDEITTVAAVTLTSKLRANCGRAGATIPNPSAMTKLAETSTQISEGSRGLRPAGSPAARVFIVEPDGRCPRFRDGTYPAEHLLQDVGHQFLGRRLHLHEMIRALERFGIDLVDVL